MKKKNINGPNLAVYRGKVYDYLGVDLGYSGEGVVKISMINYLKKIFEKFPEIIKTMQDSTVADHLFTAYDDNDVKILT